MDYMKVKDFLEKMDEAIKREETGSFISPYSLLNQFNITAAWCDYHTRSMRKLWRHTKEIYALVKRLDKDKFNEFEILIYESDNLAYGLYTGFQLIAPDEEDFIATYAINRNYKDYSGKWTVFPYGRDNKSLPNVYKTCDFLNLLEEERK